MRDFVYLAPETLEEAAALKLEHDDKAIFMAGATDVIIRLRDHLIAPDYVIDLKQIPDIGGITFSETDGLRIGALATMTQIATNPHVLAHYPYLAEAASYVGGRQIRNRATCVGNIVNASPLADTATPLYCHDAVVEIYGLPGCKEIPIRDFILFVRKVALAPGELVTGIRVPYLPGVKGVFRKVARRNEVDLSTVCGTILKTGDGWRVAMGSVAPTPLRLPKTEALLNGGPLTDALIEEAAALAATEVSPIDDVRADRQYRLDIVSYLVRDGLNKLR
ncbi:MAG: xanthine dehydrogenase family protein subunit M [Clostridiales bacterium]|nr:xanthine dehydrogenase family protein subunit M [Clostridiales bacterium]